MVGPRSLRPQLLLAVATLVSCGGGGEPPATLGQVCGDEAACEEPLTCLRDGAFAAAGYCSLGCATDPCPGGARCTADFGEPSCLRECTNGFDCESNQQCWRGTCRPPCGAAADCGFGTICEVGVCGGAECSEDDHCGPGAACDAFRCVTPPATSANPLPADVPDGGACFLSAQCTSEVCLPPELGGICGMACARFEDCGGFLDVVCAPLEIDTDLDGVLDSVRPACLGVNEGAGIRGAPCSGPDDCESRTCVSGQCTEICGADTDCLLGQVCTDLSLGEAGGPTFRGCGYRERVGDVSLDRVELGMVELLPLAVSPTYRFAVPPDTVSVMLLGQRLGGPVNTTFVNTVDGPDGARIHDLREIFDNIDQPNRWLGYSDQAWGMLIPNTTPDRFELRAGRFDVDIAAGQDEEGAGASFYSFSALIKRAADPEMLDGEIDLNVFLVGVGIDASTAADSGRLGTVLAETDRIFRQVGVRLGDIRYFDVPEEASAAYGIVDIADGEMEELLTYGDAADGNAVDVFYVRGITSPVLLGRSQLPGAAGVHGTRQSGLVVGYDVMFVGSAMNVGQTTAHELGHFLGLYHNTERLRPCRDGDRPGVDECSTFGGVDVLADTEDDDRDNLMFWADMDGSALSPGQGFVMRRNPLVH